MTATVSADRLPVWRLIAGVAVLGSLAGVLIALAPVYVRNYRLSRDITEFAAQPSIRTTPDDGVRTRILELAGERGLPVHAGDVKLEHAAGRLNVDVRYMVEMNLGLYQVDLHFHDSALGR